MCLKHSYAEIDRGNKIIDELEKKLKNLNDLSSSLNTSSSQGQLQNSTDSDTKLGKLQIKELEEKLSMLQDGKKLE